MLSEDGSVEYSTNDKVVVDLPYLDENNLESNER